MACWIVQPVSFQTPMVTALAPAVNPGHGNTRPIQHLFWPLCKVLCKLGNRLAQTAAIAVMLDLDKVAGGLLILHAAAVALLATPFERAESFRFAALAPLRANKRRDSLRL